MRFRTRTAVIAAASVAGIALLGSTLTLQAAQGAPSVKAAKPSPSPSPTAAPSGPRLYFEAGGIVPLSTTGPTITVNAPNTSAGVVAGNYLVNATVVISEPMDGSPSTVSCNLQMGGVNSSTSYQFIPDGTDAGGALATIPLQHAYSSVGAGAHVAVTCWVNGYANVVSSNVSVLQVGSIN